jgi:hypothetical protein
MEIISDVSQPPFERNGSGSARATLMHQDSRDVAAEHRLFLGLGSPPGPAAGARLAEARTTTLGTPCPSTIGSRKNALRTGSGL